MKITLLITTYNWKDALELTLNSVLRQTRMPDEIIIGDDGSRPDTKELIDRMRPMFSVPVRHIWQLDTGFRLSEIRNKCIFAADNEYIIQIDGDIILNRHFIADHESIARPRSFVVGTRAGLSPEFSKKLLHSHSAKICPFMPGVREPLDAIRLPMLSKMYLTYHATSLFGRGGNMAFWKDDIMSVNGYDESFTGWGKEDSDLIYRFMLIGLSKNFAKFKAIEYHLHHGESNMENLSRNEDLLHHVLVHKKAQCANGIFKLEA